MKTTTAPSQTPSSADLPGSPAPTVPDNSIDVVAFRKSDEGKKIVDWACSEFERCKGLKTRVARQWYINLNMTFGNQWLEAINSFSGQPQVRQQQSPKWKKRKTINRLRAFVRTEVSKFVSQLPNIVAVPASAEDEDVRAAFAAEQVWMSYAEVKRFRRQYGAAIWWTVVTGNGFLKVWWDQKMQVRLPDGVDQGDIGFRKVSPLNFFVPEYREREIDDQPYVIEAYTRPLSWAKQTYGDVLKDVTLEPTTNSTQFLLDEAMQRTAGNGGNKLDSVVVKEVWVKPGATNLLPDGGYIVMLDEILVDVYKGLPYGHGEFPYTKFEHMYNDTFWADSPLVDLIPLQKEYNELRTDLGVAARRMGNPQLLVPKGAIQASKMTNEPGSIIEYQPGLAAPTPMPLSAIPQYVIDQQDRVLTDFEDVSGQHEVSRGSAPAGITAGTALAYLGERDDAYLTPQFQGIEEGFERVAKQTLVLFQEYVDIKRKVRVVGLDGAYDTLLLNGADIAHGTDVRVEKGSSVGQSQAAKQAQVMDLVSLGIIPPDQALKMLELGGPQKILDIISAAERKAQRENMRMKAFKDNPQALQQANDQFIQQAVHAAQASGMDPNDPQVQQLIEQSMPPAIPVDDFDIHEVHIETHNRFRMSQEYETLPQEVKDEFERHVAEHQKMGGQMMQAQLMAQMPPGIAAQDAQQAGAPGGPPNGPPSGPPQGGGPGMMAPDAAPVAPGGPAGPVQ